MKEKLLTPRFVLETLNPSSHDFSNYISWMHNLKSNPFIKSVNESISRNDLIEYVNEKNDSRTAILLGIFTKLNSTHIGNVKLEPINNKLSATVGILVGEELWRGVGVGFEVLSRVLQFSFTDLELKELNLGVDYNNTVALKLYKKLGFTETLNLNNDSSFLKMKLEVSNWLQMSNTVFY